MTETAPGTENKAMKTATETKPTTPTTDEAPQDHADALQAYRDYVPPSPVALVAVPPARLLELAQDLDLIVADTRAGHLNPAHGAPQVEGLAADERALSRSARKPVGGLNAARPRPRGAREQSTPSRWSSSARRTEAFTDVGRTASLSFVLPPRAWGVGECMAYINPRSFRSNRSAPFLEQR